MREIPRPNHSKTPRLIEPIWLLLEKAGYTQEANRLKRRVILEQATRLAQLINKRDKQ